MNIDERICPICSKEMNADSIAIAYTHLYSCHPSIRSFWVWDLEEPYWDQGKTTIGFNSKFREWVKNNRDLITMLELQ